jgi:hypothetical protein
MGPLVPKGGTANEGPLGEYDGPPLDETAYQMPYPTPPRAPRARTMMRMSMPVFMIVFI